MVFTASIIASNESSSIQQRGRSYINRVKILKASLGIINSMVIGSYLYRTNIRKTAKDDYVDECSCPYGATCKHTIALAYVIERDPHLLNMLDSRKNANEPLSSQETVDRLKQIEKINLQEKERIHPPKPYKEGRGLYYRIRRDIQEYRSYSEEYPTTENHFLKIEVGKYNLRKTGELNLPYPKNLSDILYDSSLQTPLDVQILKLLSYSSQKANRYYYNQTIQLHNDIIDELFELLSRAAVVIWEESIDKFQVSPEKIQLSLESVVSDKEAVWKPVLHKQGVKKEFIPPLEIFDYHPPVVKAGSTLYRLSEDLQARIIREFGRLGPLKKESLGEPAVIDHLLNISQFAPLQLPVNWEEKSIQDSPAPLLILDREVTPWNIDIQFSYDDRTFSAGSSVPGLFVKSNSAGKIFKRNLKLEKELLSQIKTLLQVEEEFPPFRILFEKRDYFLRTVLPQLPDSWRLALKEQKKQVNRSAASFNFDQTSGINWLDIDGTVQLDTKNIRLYELLDELLKEEPFIMLKGDTHLLSEKDKAKLLRIASFYNQKERKITLTPVHIGVLSEFGDIIDTEKLSDSWKNALSALRSFTSLKKPALPKKFNATLRSYQEEGVSWLAFLSEFKFGGILADDMGLGKTIQALTILALAHQDKTVKKPSLIVAPTSVVYNWQKEIERFTPSLKPLIYVGKSRSLTKADKVDVIITSYALLWRDQRLFSNKQFHYVVLDEAHYIKNHKSQTALAARNLQADHKLSLTGTPIENNLTELWSQCSFVNPDLLGSLEHFKKTFVTPIEKFQNQEAKIHLQRLLKPFLLRRLKQNVIKDLPAKTEQLVWNDLSDKESELYKVMKEYYQAKVFKLIEQKGIKKSQIEILEALLRLRQICCHPDLLKLDERKSYPFLPLQLRDIHISTKLENVMELLETAIAEGHKVLLFSQFVSMLEIIEKNLQQKKINYLMLTGRTKTKERQAMIDRFQTDDKQFIFLLSLKAGGTGINLTAADYVIHYDPWWNPAVEVQATDRTHRIGQTKPVFVYKMLVKNSIEEKIQALQEKKKGLIEDIIGGSTHGKGLTREDLEFLFK